MSFGFGVGDLIAVANIVNTICRRLIDASDQFKAIGEEYVIPLSVCEY
jgi:hypothetical protein